MTFKSILIANRGEIAIRIARAASDLGIRSVAVYSGDDAHSLHVTAADSARALGADGAAAYLDIARVIACAKAARCDAIHPGYGFLSENAEFASACEKAGLTFIGPSPHVLSIFGDKARARALAERFGVPVLAGTQGTGHAGRDARLLRGATAADHHQGDRRRRRPRHAYRRQRRTNWRAPTTAASPKR